MDLDGGERVYRWRRGNILLLWIQMGQGQDGSEMHIFKPVWVCDGVYMDLGCNFWGLAGGEMSPGWR